MMEIALSTTKWEKSRLRASNKIFLKLSCPPTVYAKRKVFPWPGSKACRQPKKKIEVVVKVSVKA